MPRKDKCFSECSGLSNDDCDTNDKCIFRNGQKYRYCRLSTKYRMDKTDKCAITRKYRKNEVPSAVVVPSSAVPSPVVPSSAVIRKQSLKTVGRFMLNTSAKRKAYFLKSICSDSGVCITFGTENDKIKRFFGGFTSFDYVTQPIKRIGAESFNGFVSEIKYSRYGYDAYAILKSSIQISSDNLMYEYKVGQFINKLNKIFPCFLETYGIYLYESDDKWKHAKDTKSIIPSVFKKSIDILETPTYDVGCTKSKYLAVLIQHVKNATSLKSKLDEPIPVNANFWKNDLLYVLYQIYIVLYANTNNFTHYDLHADNVLLYEPVPNKYIQYHYHFSQGIVTFKSFYLAKMIDYGRCFFNDGTNSSKQEHNDVCRTRECDPDCGDDVGFSVLNPEVPPGSFHYISSQVINRSHDLRLVNIVKQYTNADAVISESLKKTLDIVKYDKAYGTKSLSSSGLPSRINNVRDMALSLQKLIINRSNIKLNDDAYSAYEKLGDLHVYLDTERPMRFIPVK